MARNKVTELGTYNVICDRCGFKFKNYQLTREWTGHMVCSGPGTNDCWEPRHPQEFVRAIPDAPKLSFTRPEGDAPSIYTPTWGLINTLGDGILLAEYRTIGLDTLDGSNDGTQMIEVYVRAVMDSTTTFSVGAWTITVPITNGSIAMTGEAKVLVKGSRGIYGNVSLPAASDTATIRSKETGAQWSDTVPATWSADDIFEMAIRYSTRT